jgi:hypothetical protein
LGDAVDADAPGGGGFVVAFVSPSHSPPEDATSELKSFGIITERWQSSA